MELMGWLLAIPQAVVCFYLTMPFFSVLLSLPWVKFRHLSEENHHSYQDFACIITCWKDAEIAVPCVDSLLKQDYLGNYHIYVVADNCDASVFEFSKEKVTIITPETVLGSKVKSILLALNSFVRKHSTVVIFDPDNLAHPVFLRAINREMSKGFKAVQGWRTAKNLDNPYACNDAMGELYYDYTTRKVPIALGSSATVAGSGMAIDAELYRYSLSQEEIVNNLEGVIVAEDKSLQADIVSAGLRIGYAPEAKVYDEKVEAGHQVARQRSRWINSYFLHLKGGFAMVFLGLKKLSFNRLYFGYLLTYPPMSILILASGTIMALQLLFMWQASLVLMACMAVFMLNFLWVLRLNRASPEIWQSLSGLPAFVGNLLKGAMKMQQAKKDFLATTHSRHLTIEEVLALREKMSSKRQ